MPRRKSNTKEFIEKAITKGGKLYDYSKFIYINSQIKGTIICKLHGEFEQSPSNHLRGAGCPDCGIIKMKLSQSSNLKKFTKKFKTGVDKSPNIKIYKIGDKSS